MSAPAWLALPGGPVVATASGEGLPVARLPFDVLRTAPVGEPAEIRVEIRAGAEALAWHEIRLVVQAPVASLLAPRPNPSRGAATVPYEVPAGRARVAVVDVLGREVAVLADGAHEAGAHEARLDPGTLAPGLYLVRLVTEAAALSRPLTVVR